MQGVQPPPSSRHWKVTGVVSLAENAKLVEVELVSAGGVVESDVSGLSVSTVQVTVGGLVSTFPTSSVACTWKV